MTLSTREQQKTWFALILSAVLLMGLWFGVGPAMHTQAYPFLIYLGSVVILWIGIPSLAVAFDTAFIPLAWLVLGDYASRDNLWTLPLVAAHMALLAYPLGSRLAVLLVTAVIAVWLDLPALVTHPPERIVNVIFLAVAALGALSFAWHGLRSRYPAPRRIDVLVTSYTSNTAFFTQQLVDEAQAQGVCVTVHRHHFIRGFRPTLTGDALVLAFPVLVWGPPWPTLEYLIRDLPRGGGRPALILYSAGGGPENAHVLPWLILTLKGYRVVGRQWAVAPFNFVMVRIPRILWRFMDRKLPTRSEVENIRRVARAFCAGQPAGMPFQLWPFPVFAIQPLVYNRWINTIYYSYAFARRCNGCGLCVRYCPAGRLTLGKDERPHGKGTCVICYGCVNVCPTNAMQLLALSELGDQYRPRWKKLLVFRKKD